MLTRKPKVGERLLYDPSAVGSKANPKFVFVKRFSGNLMYFSDQPGGAEADLVIWAFNDGLNPCFAHTENIGAEV